MLIPRTATQIPRKRVADLLFGWIWVLFQEWNHAHQNARRAVAALKSVRFPKGLLKWMQTPLFLSPHFSEMGGDGGGRKSFNSCNLMPIGLDGEGQT